MAADLTQEALRSVLSYDPQTGIFSWRASQAEAGWTFRSRDRMSRRIQIGNRCFYAHRLAWLYVHGEWPPGDIDHINCNSTDNRICNLRIATKTQNNANKGLHRNSSSGLKGVTWDKKIGRWRSNLTVEGHSIYLGCYDDPTEAHAAYVAAARRHFGKFARGCNSSAAEAVFASAPTFSSGMYTTTCPRCGLIAELPITSDESSAAAMLSRLKSAIAKRHRDRNDTSPPCAKEPDLELSDVEEALALSSGGHIAWAVFREDGALDSAWPSKEQADTSAGFCSYPVTVEKISVTALASLPSGAGESGGAPDAMKIVEWVATMLEQAAELLSRIPDSVNTSASGIASGNAAPPSDESGQHTPNSVRGETVNAEGLNPIQYAGSNPAAPTTFLLDQLERCASDFERGVRYGDTPELLRKAAAAIATLAPPEPALHKKAE